MSPSTLKAMILAEMLGIYALNLGQAVYNDVLKKGSTNDLALGTVLAATSKSALQNAIAIGGLMAILLVLADVGLGAYAAAFGGLIFAGYLFTVGADTLAAVNALKERVYAK